MTSSETTENHESRYQLLNKFREYRYEYFDELPDEYITPDAPNYQKYKCRINFIAGLSLRIQLAVSRGIIPNDKKIQEWVKYVEKRISERSLAGFNVREDRTTPEGIQIINQTLDHVIELLERNNSHA